MKLFVTNTWTRFEGDDAEREWLESYLSAEDRKFVQGKYGGENAYITRVVSVFEQGLFPSGLLPVVRRAAQAEGFAVVVQDERQEPPGGALVLSEGQLPPWLRDYQRAAVLRALKARRGVLRVPMGGGKTEIFIALSLALPVEWLYLVQKTDLVRQTLRKYAEWTGEQAGTLDGGEWKRGTSNVTVAGFSAWWAALKRGAPAVAELGQAVEALNVDEAHTVSAETLYRGTLALPNAYYRIGQSGTPLHRGELDNLRVIGALGPVVYRLETQELVERGVLATTTVRMVECEQRIAKADAPSTWRGFHTKMIMRSKHRNKLVARVAQRAQKPCLLFIERIEHGDSILKELRALGLKAAFVHGEASPSKRKREVEKLVEGEYEVLVCNEIFSTGLDAPDVRSTVNAAGGRAPIGTLQRMGRALRKKSDGSLECETWDVYDTGHPWLDKHSQCRSETYASEGWSVSREHEGLGGSPAEAASDWTKL